MVGDRNNLTLQVRIMKAGCLAQMLGLVLTLSTELDQSVKSGALSCEFPSTEPWGYCSNT